MGSQDVVIISLVLEHDFSTNSIMGSQDVVIISLVLEHDFSTNSIMGSQDVVIISLVLEHDFSTNCIRVYYRGSEAVKALQRHMFPHYHGPEDVPFRLSEPSGKCILYDIGLFP
jgi:hypothetical protein